MNAVSKNLPSSAAPSVRRFIDLAEWIRTHSDETITLGSLSKRVGLSPAHLQRQFKATLGISPKDFLQACRLNVFRKELRNGKQVTESLYRAGYSSSSRLYEKVDSRLGMTPSQYRQGGQGLEISYVCEDTPLGRLILCATDRGICLIEFGKDDSELLRLLKAEFPLAQIAQTPQRTERLLKAWMKLLTRYLRHEGRGREPFSDFLKEAPLEIIGTAFQTRVWNYLRKIPLGQTRSYQEVARSLGQPQSSRAVARACAQNRIAVLIPCHRVLRGDGSLAGYRWGLEKKADLLRREKQLSEQSSSQKPKSSKR